MRLHVRLLAAAIALVIGAPAAKGGIESYWLAGDLDPEVGGHFSGTFSYRTFSDANVGYCGDWAGAICIWPVDTWNITVHGGWYDEVNFSTCGDGDWCWEEEYIQIAEGATRLQRVALANWYLGVFLTVDFEGVFKDPSEGPFPFPRNAVFHGGYFQDLGMGYYPVTYATVTPEPPVAVLTAFVLVLSGWALLRRSSVARR